MATISATRVRAGDEAIASAGIGDWEWHCVVATRSEDFLFRICFELGAIPEARVTGCVSLFQGWRTASEDPPSLVVIDATLVDEDPDGVLTLAGCVVPGGTLLVMTDDRVQEMRSQWGTTRLIYRQRPETPGELSGFLAQLVKESAAGAASSRRPEPTGPSEGHVALAL